MKRLRNRSPRFGALFGAIFGAGLGAIFGVVIGLLLLFGGLQTASAVAPAIYTFTGTDGAYPETALVQGRDGNFYGTTGQGGSGTGNNTNGDGTIFKMTTDGTPAGTTLTTLVNFNYANGYVPIGPMILGSDGSFYGTTALGGSNGDGTIFKMTTDGTPAGTTLTTLVNFTAAIGHGTSALLQDRDGSFYGTTIFGGSSNDGTVFKMTTDGTPAGTTLTTLVNFNGADGTNPQAALIQGSDGGFYGTTEGGGSNSDGTVFKMTTDGTFAGTTLTTLVNFNGANGSDPEAALVQGSDGSFYGTTNEALIEGGTDDVGTVFRMTTDGTAAGTTLTTLTSFNGANGANPQAALVEGDDGNFYGTTENGGSSVKVGGEGTVFKMTPTGDLRTLVNFNGPNGAFPDIPLIQGSDGKFYGVTTVGGKNKNSVGTVYAIDPRAIQSVTFTPMTLTGGKTAMGEVTLSHVADTDKLVTLTSSNPAVLPIRSSVTITTGHRHALFTVTAKPVTARTVVTITATLNGVSSYSAVTITP